ncbi:MAG: hypothetical protein DI586_03965 [Micavibrio aeruginosavorus]|uniref:FMN dependent NADH:quinone oxidoreductase n=1 Tax=Micavibrio aeruginosavorus TaxID=349221 RepID=A0A2W5FRC7_9BACT|nr:MAG: hypothetical protein DI586_03965 [Micavibrio aeruginosavorus]
MNEIPPETKKLLMEVKRQFELLRPLKKQIEENLKTLHAPLTEAYRFIQENREPVLEIIQQFRREVLPYAELFQQMATHNAIEKSLEKAGWLPHYSTPIDTVLGGSDMASNDQAGLALSNQLIDELMASDTLVIEVPMYNFSIPSVLKAWIDHVARQGKTFAYSAAGPEGLAKGKRAILVLGSGGVYSEGPAKTMEHTESYLRILLGFIGITDVEAIYIEGVGMGPDKAAEALEKATQRANALA